jgi:hypothetical protein
MSTLVRPIGILLAAAVALGACSSGSSLGGTGGAAGTAAGGSGTGGSATGGIPGTGGSDTGGSPGTGGIVTGTGGSFVTGTGGSVTGAGGFSTGTGGGPPGPSLPDGGACSAPTMGPLSTADAPRPFGWKFTGMPADGGAGGAGGKADGGAIPGGCQVVPAPYPGTRCIGTAQLHGTATGPVITFQNGSQLLWDGTLAKALTPIVEQTDGGVDSVWVEYENRTVVVCPFCGAYTTNTLQIRDSQGGPIRFYDQQGDVLPNLTDAQISELFGVGAAALQSCTFPTYAGCYSFLRTEFDHQLQTSPPQTIIDATLTPVMTPNGKFEVVWASSVESYSQRVTGCSDGPGIASDTGFVANRLSR